ncbi:MAG: nitroreductase family protein [Candidatus Aminicenantes bacterium]|nr:nitroreductase family protein [Candidatus Aminicenantes bacterium]
MENRIIPFRNLVQERRSIRSFSEIPVEREKVMLCLEAARMAPSADNAQPWRFLVIDDPDVKSQFSKEVFSGIYFVTRFAAKAPVLILIMARLNFVAHKLAKQIQDIRFQFLDIGIAGEHIVLQAQDLGLGSCWIGWFDTRKARKYFQIPKSYKIMALIALGYAEKKPEKPKKRKSLEEIVWFNKPNR